MPFLKDVGEFLFGGEKKVENIPSDIEGLRTEFADFFSSQGFDRLSGGATLPGQFINDPMFTQQIIEPFRQLFSQNRERGLAQAKESAGNLTGSGFANILGGEVNRSLQTENAFISDLINRFATSSAQLSTQAQQSDAQRFAQLLGLFTSTGVGSPETFRQPGFLEDFFSLIGQVGGSVAAAQGAGAGG